MRPAILTLALGFAACASTPASVPSDAEQVLRETEEAAPIIGKVQYAAIEDEKTAILVTLAEGESAEAVTWSFDGKAIELKDDGKDGDNDAGDNVFTGVADAGLSTFQEARESYTNAIADRDSLTATRFDGHRVSAIVEVGPGFVDELTLEEVSLDALGGVFEAQTVFPIVTTDDGAPALPPAAHDPYRTLVITEPELMHNTDFTGSWQMDNGDCAQVGNPNGPAGFRSLIAQIASGHFSADEFVSRWLLDQSVSRTVNGYSISSPGQGIYDLHNGSPLFPPTPQVPWPKLWDDGNAGTYNDILDAALTPVQLTAIVNRFDLAAGGYEGRGGEAELRFVFTFIDEETCEATNGNLILEYAVPLEDCGAIENWADLWQQLDQFDPVSADYVDFLATQIIEPVVASGANPARPNESNLKVLRTNEQSLHWPHYMTIFPTHEERDWFMEEWAIDDTTHLLVNQTLAQTPGWDWVDPDLTAAYPHPQDVDDYINTEEADILAGTHQVGATYNGNDFASPVVRYGKFSLFYGPYSASWTGHNWRAMSWGSANVNSIEARQQFSLSTCSGCHAGEVFEDSDGTSAFQSSNWESSVPGGQLEEPFRHVIPGNPLLSAASLSRFLTGTNSSCSPGNEFVSPLGTMSACAVDTCCPIGDPVFGYDEGQVHYNEFARRGGILQDVLLNGCSALDTAPTSTVVASAH